MKIVFAYLRNKNCKIKTIGNTLDLLSLLVAISKLMVERVSKENNINIKEAEKFIIECVSDGMKTIPD